MQTKEHDISPQTQAAIDEARQKWEKEFDSIIKEASQNLQKLFRQANPTSTASLMQETSGSTLGRRGKANTSNTRIFEEMAMAAYYNRNNPNWDPAVPESYLTELAEDDPLRYLFPNAGPTSSKTE